MATSESKIIVKLEAEVGKLTTELNKAQKRISGFEKQSTKSAAAVSATFSRLDTALKAAISVYSLRQAAQLSDTYTEINSRLRLVTGSTDEFAAAQQGVFSIAQRTRQSFAATAELYQRLAQSTDGLGISQGRLLQITETVNKAITISGVSSQAAQAAIVQLGQGLSAGALRGQEFNSVVEQTPRLAKALADGLGVNIGKLREMAKEGQLTADVVIAALEGQAAAIQSEFGNVGATVGQAMQTLENSFVAIIGGAADASGAQRGVTEAITEFSEALNDPAVVSGANALAVGVVDAFKWITRTIAEAANVTKFFAEEIASRVAGISGDDIARLEMRADEMRAILDGSGSWFDRRLTLFGENGIFDFETNDKLKEKLSVIEKQISDYYANQQNRPHIPIEIGVSVGSGGDVDPASAMKAAEAAKLAAAAKKDQERAAKQLQSTFENTLSQYQREIALSGEATEVDRIRYEIASGNLRGINAAQQKRLEGLAREIDRIAEVAEKEEARAKLQQEVSSLTASLRTDEETALDNYIESMNTLNRAIAAGIPILGGFDEASRRVFEKYQEDLKKAAEDTGQISIAWDEALRGIQGHLADFLFDPFKDGLDGMLDGFINVIRRMAAEAAAAQIMDGLFGSVGSNGQRSGGVDWAAVGTSIIGIFGGARATGGPVDAGRAYMVGERGPEMFVPDAAGRIEPNSGGGDTFNLAIYPQGNSTPEQAAMAGGAAGRSALRAIENARRYS